MPLSAELLRAMMSKLLRLAPGFSSPPPGVSTRPCRRRSCPVRSLASQPSRNDGIGHERGPFWPCRASERPVRNVGRARSPDEWDRDDAGKGGGETKDGKKRRGKRAKRVKSGAQYGAKGLRDDFVVGSSPVCNPGFADCLFSSVAFGKVIDIVSVSERYLSKGPPKKPGARIMSITFPPKFCFVRMPCNIC